MTPEEEAERWPEHAKVSKQISNTELVSITNFIDWLKENGYFLARYNEGTYPGADDEIIRVFTPTINLVAESLGVDIEKYNAENDDMLDYLREWQVQNKADN